MHQVVSVRLWKKKKRRPDYKVVLLILVVSFKMYLDTECKAGNGLITTSNFIFHCLLLNGRANKYL
jgi:hypothetical protein